MLTRAQVAARLGKSIATIRRMEGRELHPRRDAHGVHRFCPKEVAAIARAPRTKQWSGLSEPFWTRSASERRAASFELESMRARVRDKARSDRVDTFVPVLTAGKAVHVSGKVNGDLETELAARDARIAALEHELARAIDVEKRAERLEAQNAELREVLTLTLECLVAQLGPRTPPDILEAIETIARQHAPGTAEPRRSR